MPKTADCNKRCGQTIWFNWEAKAGEPGRSDFGKLIPLQVNEKGELLNERHQCPNSTYGKSNGGATGAAAKGTQLSQDTLYDIVAKIEKLNVALEGLEGMIKEAQEEGIERLDSIIARLKAAAGGAEA